MLIRFDIYGLIRKKRRANKNSQSRDTRIRGHKAQNKDKLSIKKPSTNLKRRATRKPPGRTQIHAQEEQFMILI
jgi:hypothetical protein